MAEALLDKVLGKLGSEETPAYEVLEKYVGKDLEYKEYEPLFACAGEDVYKRQEGSCGCFSETCEATGI